MTYQPGIPTGLVPLNQDYLNIKNNFGSLNTQWQVDHVPLTSTSGSPPNGYHIPIHMVPFSTTASNPPNNYPPTIPTATAGYGQLWSPQINDGINTDTALYFLTGGNRSIPLTRNFAPVASTNGYTFLPGGIIMQWGTLTGISVPDTGTITFSTSGNIKFPNAVFLVSLSPILTAVPGGSFNIGPKDITETGFTWYASGSSALTAFSWIALGN